MAQVPGGLGTRWTMAQARVGNAAEAVMPTLAVGERVASVPQQTVGLRAVHGGSLMFAENPCDFEMPPLPGASIQPRNFGGQGNASRGQQTRLAGANPTVLTAMEAKSVSGMATLPDVVLPYLGQASGSTTAHPCQKGGACKCGGSCKGGTGRDAALATLNRKYAVMRLIGSGGNNMGGEQVVSPNRDGGQVGAPGRPTLDPQVGGNANPCSCQGQRCDVKLLPWCPNAKTGCPCPPGKTCGRGGICCTPDSTRRGGCGCSKGKLPDLIGGCSCKVGQCNAVCPCPAGQACNNGVCCPIGACNAACPCPVGQTCQNGACVTPVPVGGGCGSPCPSSGELPGDACGTGQDGCGNGCCQNGLSCFNGKCCQPKPCDGTICDNGCGGSCPCPAGLVCKNGICTCPDVAVPTETGKIPCVPGKCGCSDPNFPCCQGLECAATLANGSLGPFTGCSPEFAKLPGITSRTVCSQPDQPKGPCNPGA